MSILFNLVQRKPWNGQISCEPPTIKNTTRYTKETFYILPGGKICDITNAIEAENVTLEVKLITSDETFCQNALKAYYLQNVTYHLPQILYFFRPEVALDIAVKTTIKQLSGITDQHALHHLQLQNKGIYDHFTTFYKVTCNVYQFSISCHSGIPDGLTKLILCGLIEFMNLQRNEDYDFPMISYDQLKEMGAYIRFDDTNYKQTSTLQTSRDALQEYNLVSIHFMCFICKARFHTTNELKKHINTHKESLVCMSCEFQFTSYIDYCAHKLTFCRDSFNKQCLYCLQNKQECTCTKNAKILYTYIKNNLKEYGNDNMYQNLSFSMFLQYLTKNTDIQDRFSLQKVDQNVPIMAPTQHWPVFKITNGTNEVEITNYNIKVKYRDLKEIIFQYTVDFQTLKDFTFNFMTSTQTKCNICDEVMNNKHYINSHHVCNLALQRGTDEMPIAYEVTQLIEHVIENHTMVRSFNGYNCIICGKKYTTLDDIDSILLHLKEHEESYNYSCDQKYASCDSKKSIEQTIAHKLSHHIPISTTATDKIIEIFMLKPADNNLITFGSEVGTHTPQKQTSRSFIETLIKSAKKDKENKVTHTSESSLENKIFKTQNKPTNSKKFVLPDNNQNSDKEWSDDEEKNTDSEENNDNEDDDDDEDKNEDDKDKEKYIKEKMKGFYCKNEDHKEWVKFKTKLQKELHIIKHHVCSFQGCGYFSELNINILKHYKNTHIKNKLTECKICGKHFTNMEEHLETHPKCDSCQNRFIDSTTLYNHMKECFQLKKKELKDENTSNMGMIAQNANVSLSMDNSNTEYKFSEYLIKLLENSGLKKDEILEGSKIFSRYATEQLLHKKSLRSESYQALSETSLLFELPQFTEKETLKENLTKASQLLQVKPEDKFEANTKKANINAILNFEILEDIIIKINRVVSLCGLREIQTKIFFMAYLSETVIDEINGYNQLPFLEISYYNILLSLQRLYCPIRVDILEAKVMSYTKDESESMFQFSDRCRRHLQLISKKMPPDERKNYIELHVSRLLRASLPSELLKSLMQKEHLYSEFSSNEILNFYIAQTQKLTTNLEQYNVFQTTSRIRSNKDTKKKIFKRKTYVVTNDTNKQTQAYNKQKGFQNNDYYKPKQKQQNVTPKLTFQEKVKIVSDLTKMNNVCLKCLDTTNLHKSSNCDKYYCQISDKMHYIYKNGKRIPHGFHPENLCLEKETSFRQRNNTWKMKDGR